MTSNLLIVGAGFSSYAGLPLANQFTEYLLRKRGLAPNGPSVAQIEYLRKFVDRAFGEGLTKRANDWPDLEDILTTIDLAANTGHHLGPKYGASDLRIVRRALIVRMIRMLSQRYKSAQAKAGPDWSALEKFFDRLDVSTTAVLNMNWDSVFERGIARNQSIRTFDYGCDAREARFDDNILKLPRPKTGPALKLFKPHGSVNWLYCDACRETFWVPPKQVDSVASTLFREKDWNVVLDGAKMANRPRVLDPACPHCRAHALGTRFATFSYRKALDFPMHAASWRSAEVHLKGAADWVFLGYSMPPADYEFKYLLKRVQLSEWDRPNITLITGGDGADETARRFEKFFGTVSGARTYLKNGLDASAFAHLKSLGVLKA